MQNEENKIKSAEIIIPAYNAKETIKRALYSIAIQKKIEKIKLTVYIINDGSDYDYKEEIEYFSKYFNIKELKIDNNMGPGYARQFGIDNSYEDYIVFLDADDYLFSPYSIARLYSNINSRNDDLVISRFVRQKGTCLIPSEIDYRWLHGKIYSRNFLEDNNIRFNPIRINEDCGFNFLLKFHNPKVSTINDVTYVYAYNENSITRKDNFLCKYTRTRRFLLQYGICRKESFNKKIRRKIHNNNHVKNNYNNVFLLFRIL